VPRCSLHRGTCCPASWCDWRCWRACWRGCCRSGARRLRVRRRGEAAGRIPIVPRVPNAGKQMLEERRRAQRLYAKRQPRMCTLEDAVSPATISSISTPTNSPVVAVAAAAVASARPSNQRAEDCSSRLEAGPLHPASVVTVHCRACRYRAFASPYERCAEYCALPSATRSASTVGR